MIDPITAYPLAWPLGWKRTPGDARKRAAFGRQSRTESGWQRKVDLTINDAIERVLVELRGFGIRRDQAIISTNLTIRLDGLPYSGQRAPADPGAAVYWRRSASEIHHCMAIDQYLRVQDNLAAIAATLNYMRGIERHGGAEILSRAFEGFAALPAAGGTSAPAWWDVLGVERTAGETEIRAAYRVLAKQLHPDNRETGDAERFIVLQKAYEQALTIQR